MDTENENVVSSIEDEMLAVLAHEIHHCVRMDEIDDVTLADRLVIEGLACRFECEMTGMDIPSFLSDTIVNSWHDLYARMKNDLISENFSERTLFLGENPEQFPMYAGYAVGFALVEDYLDRKNLSAADCVCLPTAELLAL